MESLSTYILYFFMYSFFGWVSETIYCSIGGMKFVNRGFLNGPICPIYGFGALFVLLMLKNYSDNVNILFIYGVIVTSILEYVTSIALEKIFHAKWWDYSKKPFNICGRICLKNSIIFGVMAVVLTKIIHPQIKKIISLIPKRVVFYLAIILIIWILAEVITTLISLNKLSKKLKGLGEVRLQLEKINIKLEKFDNQEITRIVDEMKNDDNHQKILEEVINKIHYIKSKTKIQRRIIKAFPNLEHKKHHNQLQELKKILKNNSK